MSASLFLQEFDRVLAGAAGEAATGTLAAMGFLDLCVAEEAGGGGLAPAELFPFALSLGASLGARPWLAGVLDTIIARSVDPKAGDVDDLERFLRAAGREDAGAVAAVATAGLMAGAMRAMLAMTAEYALVRKQFGRPVAQFQAVQQQMAVMAEETVAARMAAEWAFLALGTPAIGGRAAVAKFRANRAASVATAVAHAVHGAIGVSAEHSLSGFVHALRSWRLSHGGDRRWAGALGKALLGGDIRAVDFVRSL